jgi:GNAT superfamily N-acetyltransferase
MTFVIDRFDPAVAYAGFNQFDCGHSVINKFVKDSLKKQVRNNLSVAYAILEESQTPKVPDRFVGFYTLTNHSIALERLSALQLGSMPKIIPCVRLVMLGVNKSDAGQGYGRDLMNHAFDIVKDGAKKIGCFGVYLDADAKALPFYQKLGFKLLEGDLSPRSSPVFITMSGIA